MNLTPCQVEAERHFEAFLDSEDRLFGLFGFAGTGKSFMLARFIRQYIEGGDALLGSPTHKAAHVMRRFLTRAGIAYEDYVPQDRRQKVEVSFGSKPVIVGTTAQLIGIRPDISEDQDATDLKFKRVGKGLIEQMWNVDWIVIDEISMLSAADFRFVRQLAKDHDARVLAIGDPAQLSPVNAQKINYKDIFKWRAAMTTVCRTDDDTGITTLANAVRKGLQWRSIRGSAVEHVTNAAALFLQDLTEPPGPDETEWSVYIAYRNVAVDQVNEAACRKLYGHGRFDIAAGEHVLASDTFYQSIRGRSVPLCTNGDLLYVDHVGRGGVWGPIVTVRNVRTGEVFVAEYLREQDRANPHHPFNIKLAELKAKALQLQSEYTRSGAEGEEKMDLDAKRRVAWVDYYGHRDHTVLSLSHPFAITSHKAQGSTYRRAYVDATDMAPFERSALYVGVTRPSNQLVIG